MGGVIILLFFILYNFIGVICIKGKCVVEKNKIVNVGLLCV